MKNSKQILFIVHIIFLIIFFVISLFFAPFVAFLYDDPRGAGFLLYLFSFLWFCMPAFVLGSLVVALILSIGKRKKIAKKITFLPYFIILLELVVGYIFFNFK